MVIFVAVFVTMDMKTLFTSKSLNLITLCFLRSRVYSVPVYTTRDTTWQKGNHAAALILVCTTQLWIYLLELRLRLCGHGKCFPSSWPRNNTKFLKRYCKIGAPNVFISVKENWKRKAFTRRLLVVCSTCDLDESHNLIILICTCITHDSASNSSCVL